MKKLIASSVAVLLISIAALAQAPDILWTRAYGGDRVDDGWYVQQTTDGGYIVAGVKSSL